MTMTMKTQPEAANEARQVDNEEDQQEHGQTNEESPALPATQASEDMLTAQDTSVKETAVTDFFCK